MLDRQMTEGIIKGLKSIENDRQVRLVAILSAAIAVSNADLTEKVIKTLKQLDVGDLVIYETVLQSYLFLGFPRMIEASLVYNKVYGDIENNEDIRKISEIEAKNWYEDGIKLCRVVYGKNFEKLKKRFLSVSPELFRWMVLEGYGKVLSRPGMNRIERELAEVAALIVDKRERQLVSHILGSLNVGATMSIIKRVNEDIRPIAGDDAYKMAVRVIAEIEEKK
ncbi:MAG TPA: carboxymuconolactone decarboxylase family protein [candidate division Zixibacteria bacterium]|nr:carboxymuconolactone decarboxylase family protein [candidate division Zixibacteria bacterium]